ncbi:MAG: FAD-binding oxidoreductase [Candidatus Levybacteria bacterium]|nr:FAD-binding oxidoreductase [Candidatus Levybacteria bacterium]MBP9815077.1 FAD-binding oxidoreductase [Candidatus Levybacteria bacterium]
MDEQLIDELKKVFSGDIENDPNTLSEYSHDASLFEVKPQLVVFPKSEKDVTSLVTFVERHKKNHPTLSLTARSGGTDMGGGSINDSIIVAFGKYFNHTPIIDDRLAITEPGVFYRDFEKETIREGLIFPSYPASREICAMGGIVNNNSGGEKSLYYGKTEKYVHSVKVVLRDGNIYNFHKISEDVLNKKMLQKNLEGEIYKKMFHLIDKNYKQIMDAKPMVSKNSAGYNLWNVYNKEEKTFDLSKLWVGAQGTLGILLEAKIDLVPLHMHREMMIVFLHDLSHLGEIIKIVMSEHPESFESYDDNTLKLALKYFPEFAKKLGAKGIIGTGIAFLPEFMMVARGGLPKLVLQIDFTGNDAEELKRKIASLKKKLEPLHPKSKIAIENQEQKYWLIRRESFNLLRQKIKNKHTAPFIDDFVIRPEYIAEVIPKVVSIIKKHKEFIFTVAGHVGDGNFHIIPLVDITKPSVRRAIPEISRQVYDLVISYHGSITGEHNDGLVRTPYLKQMYGEKIYDLFSETKNIFDPQNIFNPRKKIGGTLSYAMSHLRTNW